MHAVSSGIEVRVWVRVSLHDFKNNSILQYENWDNFRTGVYLFMHAVSSCILL